MTTTQMWRVTAVVLLAVAGDGLSQPAGDGEILLNPGFEQDADGNGLPDHWSTSSERVRWREDVFMSHNYSITSIPPTYVLATQDLELEKGQTYTLTMRCKGLRGGLAGALIVHGETKPEREMPILWNLRVSDRFEDYIRTFTAPNPAARLYLYNIAKAKGEVTYDRVSLRKGLPDRVVITKLSFKDIDLPLSPPLETRHIDWASPLAGGPIRAYITLRSFRCLRQVVELEQRLDLDCDVIHTGYYGKEAASTTAGRAMDRLKARDYEVYVVPSRIGDRMADTIRQAVEGGAGLVIVEGFGRAKQLIGDRPLERIDEGDWLLRGIPWDLLPAKLLDRAETGMLGKGRVVRLVFPMDSSRVWGLMPVQIGGSSWRAREFEYWEWWESLLAKAVLWAARGCEDPGVRVSSNAPGTIRLIAADAPVGSRFRVLYRSAREIRFDGPLRRSSVRVIPLDDGHGADLSIPPDFPAGRRIVDWQLLDGEGKVLDWGSHADTRPARITIEEVTARPVGGDSGRRIEARVRLRGEQAVAGDLSLAVIDAEGRTLSRVLQATAGGIGEEGIDVVVPVRHPQTVLQRVFAAVSVDGVEQDSAWTAVYLPEVGPKQAASDFTAIPWQPGMSHPLIVENYTRLTREIGLNGDFPGDPFLNAERGLPSASYMGGLGMFRETKHIESGVRRQCLHSADVRAAIDAKAEAAATRHRGSGIFAAGITDEAFLSSRHSRTEFCFGEDSQAAYRAWLQAEYGSLEALNRRWETHYASWGEIRGVRSEDVRGRRNFAPFVDFRTFMVDTWVSSCRQVTDAYHGVLPHVAVGHTNTFGANPFNGNDYWKLATETGFGWGQEYSEAIKGSAHKAIFDLWRSFVETPEARSSRAVDGQAGPFFNYGWIGYQHSESAAHYEPWWLAMHGSRGVSYYATNSIAADRGVSWALVYPTQSLTPFSLAVQEALRDLRSGCGKLFMTYDREVPRTGILWSHPSMLVAWCESTQTNPVPDERPGCDSYGAYFRSAFNFRQHLNENQLDYVYIDPQQILSGDVLKRIDVLFLPFSVAVPGELVDALDRFVKEGGTLVGDVRCLRTDEHGIPFRDDQHLRRLFGVGRQGDDAMTYGASTLTFEKGDHGIDLAGQAAEVFAREGIAAADAEPLAHHATGEPAMLLRGRGKGRTLYLNFLLPEYDVWAREMVRQICGLAGVPRPVRVVSAQQTTPPRCYELNTFRRGEITVYGLIRDHRRCEDEDPVTVQFDGRRHIYDVRHRTYLGATSQASMVLPPGETALFACLPYQVAAVRITCPDEVVPGEDFTLEAQVNAAGGDPGDHILHVEFRDPTGFAPSVYSRNLVAAGGRLEYVFATALNDSVGQWQLVVRDVMSGVEQIQQVTFR